jgi:hypothetical protein
MIENPQPAWLSFLLLALPGIAFAAFALNQALFPRGDRPLCTIPAIGLVLALLPAHVLALAAGSLSIGLAAAWTLIGAAGYAWILRHWREVRFDLSIKRVGWAHKLGITGLATLPIILPTILLNFFDETCFTCHHAIIAHLQNGTYPPRYLYDPSLPLRYHYAFDLAGAIITGLLRVRVDHAIDLLKLTLWPCMFLLLWRVGEHVGGRRAGPFVALTVSFLAGWCVFCSVFPSLFFQHPWSIAIPIFCLVVLQRAALFRIENRTFGLAALVCSLTLLALSEAVLFVATVAALGLTEVWYFMRCRDRSAGAVLLALATAVVSAKLIGGFFVSAPYPPAGGFFGTEFSWHDYSSLNAVLTQILLNVVLFGVLLAPGIIGLFHARHERVFLTILAIIGFIVYNFLSYLYTVDIYKFTAITFISLAVGGGIFVSDLANWANTGFRKLIRGALIGVLLLRGILFHFTALSPYDLKTRLPFSEQMIVPYFSVAYPVDRDDARAVSFLRSHMGPLEIAYRTEAKSEPYANWGGLPTQASVYPSDSGDNDQYGLGAEKFAARKNLITISETWFDRLLAEHISWVVTDADDVAINSVLDSLTGQHKVVLAAQYGDIRIFRVQ